MAARSSSFSSFFGSIGGEDNNSLQNKQMPLQQFSSTTTTTTTTTTSSSSAPTQAPPKKRRNQPGNPNPDADIVALSPRTLMATNRFICEVCNKGFQREQNLQLHRRGHNLPWKLKQKSNNKEVMKKKVYVCPESTCVHHDPSRALGDLTGIKKHYYRKHGEKKWKCDKCSKRYAVQSDWKAHSKTCGTREYRCDCGTLFSRRDSFITHRAFCDALTRETARNPSSLNAISSHLYGHNVNRMNLSLSQSRTTNSHISSSFHRQDLNTDNNNNMLMMKQQHIIPTTTANHQPPPPLPPPAFFMHDTAQLGFHQDHLQHQPAAGHNVASFASKPFHDHQHGLTQLQLPHHLQTNANDIFNLGLFKGHSSSTSTTAMNSHVANVDDQGINITFFPNNVGESNQLAAGASGFSSLFSPNSLQHHNNTTSNVHTSATALLQKAAQIGSNPSAYNSTTLLGGLASSTSSNNLASGGQHVENNNDNNLQGFMNSFVNGAAAAGSNNIFLGAGQVQNGNPTTGYNINANFDENFDEAELRRNLGLSIGGSDRLTLDFLGVGEMVRNVGINPEASFSRRESQQLDVSVSNSSLDTEMKSSLASNPFGGD